MNNPNELLTGLHSAIGNLDNTIAALLDEMDIAEQAGDNRRANIYEDASNELRIYRQILDLKLERLTIALKR
jgi:hypothetical protein